LTIKVRSGVAALDPLIAIPADHDVARLQHAAGRAILANRRHQQPAVDAA
jgi:hypothetical protein